MPENATSAQSVRFADFRRDPQAHPLRTDGRKIEVYSARIAGYGYADCRGHPTWLESDGWFGNAEPDQLQLLSAHPVHRLHSQLNYSALREQYVVADREPVTVHLQGAHARGIADGDTVRAWNQREQVLVGAVATAGIRPGVIRIHEGARPDLDLAVNGICKNGVVNVLIKDLPSSKLGNGCVGNTALAWFEKYSGLMLAPTVPDPPASP